jgi:hypothetical protein
MIRKSVCPLWHADIPPALCRKARPSAATYTTSRDTILANSGLWPKLSKISAKSSGRVTRSASEYRSRTARKADSASLSIPVRRQAGATMQFPQSTRSKPPSVRRTSAPMLMSSGGFPSRIPPFRPRMLFNVSGLDQFGDHLHEMVLRNPIGLRHFRNRAQAIRTCCQIEQHPHRVVGEQRQLHLNSRKRRSTI